jgi:hypothetical protein
MEMVESWGCRYYCGKLQAGRRPCVFHIPEGLAGWPPLSLAIYCSFVDLFGELPWWFYLIGPGGLLLALSVYTILRKGPPHDPEAAISGRAWLLILIAAGLYFTALPLYLV